MPSLRMRAWSVVRFMPRTTAAPLGPAMRHCVCFRAFAKGRDLNGENIEAVIKVAAESALAYEFGKVLMGGGDDADIHALCAVAPEALEFLFLQNAQQFGLEVERKVADFIKKERAAVGQFEAADLLIDGPSERALFMAE